MGAVGRVRVLIGFEWHCWGGRKSSGGFVGGRDTQVGFCLLFDARVTWDDGAKMCGRIGVRCSCILSLDVRLRRN